MITNANTSGSSSAAETVKKALQPERIRWLITILGVIAGLGTIYGQWKSYLAVESHDMKHPIRERKRLKFANLYLMISYFLWWLVFLLLYYYLPTNQKQIVGASLMMKRIACFILIIFFTVRWLWDGWENKTNENRSVDKMILKSSLALPISASILFMWAGLTDVFGKGLPNDLTKDNIYYIYGLAGSCVLLVTSILGFIKSSEKTTHIPEDKQTNTPATTITEVNGHPPMVGITVGILLFIFFMIQHHIKNSPTLKHKLRIGGWTTAAEAKAKIK